MKMKRKRKRSNTANHVKKHDDGNYKGPIVATLLDFWQIFQILTQGAMPFGLPV